MHNNLKIVNVTSNITRVGYRILKFHPTWLKHAILCHRYHHRPRTGHRHCKFDQMEVGTRNVRELLRRIVCLEWCKSTVYEVRVVNFDSHCLLLIERVCLINAGPFGLSSLSSANNTRDMHREANPSVCNK